MALELPASVLGFPLLAVLFNSLFCGIITKQHYLYWTSGYKDPIYVRILVVAQFSIVVCQSVLSCLLAWNIFISVYNIDDVPKETWEAPVNSICQCILIIMANTFLAFRIYYLTSSRLKAGLVFGLSLMAFITGVVSNVMNYSLGRNSIDVSGLSQRALSVVGHSLQAIAEFFIMYFLSQALLTSRSGIKGSDQVVHHLVRNVIQIGLFAMLWAVIGLSTFFLLPHLTIYSVFDSTSGSIYTHMIYDGLLSRQRLRLRIAQAERNQVNIGLPTQGVRFQTLSPSSISRGQDPSETTQGQGDIPLANLANKDGYHSVTVSSGSV